MKALIDLLKEFAPSLLFLGKFLGLYLVLNFSYGLYIDYYFPNPDPVTIWASDHSGWVLQVLGEEVEVEPSYTGPKVWLKSGEKIILSVFEGCSGLNVGIIFFAFVMAFSTLNTRMLWFVPLGLLIIHLSNLARIVLLYYVTIYRPGFVYFTHKYLFTGFLYLIILGLWYLWVMHWMPKKSTTSS